MKQTYTLLEMAESLERSAEWMRRMALFMGNGAAPPPGFGSDCGTKKEA